MSKRALVVTTTNPWGPASGVRLRQRIALDALVRDHVVDLVVASQLPDVPQAPDPAIHRATNILVPSRAPRHVDRLRSLWPTSPPLDVLVRDTRTARAALASWVRGPYAVTWIARSSTFDALAPVLPDAPVVVDLDDLEGAKLEGRLESSVRSSSDGSVTGAHRLRAAWNRRKASAWHAFDRRVARQVTAVLVCSPLDADRIDADNTAIVPNGYPRPTTPRGRVEVSTPPTILLQGELTYGPNVDGAEFFVRDVLPKVRAALPDVRLRLVGHAGPAVARLHASPAVTVTGFVDDMEAELAQADLIVVPIRYGGGTRIKILEGWSHRIPIVATTRGAEGLEGTDGVHFLLADDPEQLAATCVRALTDHVLRARLSERGEALFLDRYERGAVIEAVAALVAVIQGD